MPVSAMESAANLGPRQNVGSGAIEASEWAARQECDEPDPKPEEPSPEEPSPDDVRRGSIRTPVDESGRGVTEVDVCRGFRAASLRSELELAVRDALELDVCKGLRIES